jgi:tetraacyldisaccharide 4'-kinase
VLKGRLEPEDAAVRSLRGRRTLAFAGIADPDKFFATLADAGVPAEATVAFPDHHRYRASEADALLAKAERRGLELVTTEKDFARLQGDPALARLAAHAKTLPAVIRFEDEEAMRRLLRRARPAVISRVRDGGVGAPLPG